MSLGEVYNIDVVADARAVGSVVVVTEDLQLLAHADSCLRDKRNEVHGHTDGQLANLCAGMSADGVEVAQHDRLDGSTRVDVVGNNLLVDLLRVAIGRQGLLDGSLLGDGQVLLRGLSVDGARAGEDDAFHVVLRHEFQQVDERHDVVAIVKQRLLHTLTHGL